MPHQGPHTTTTTTTTTAAAASITTVTTQGAKKVIFTGYHSGEHVLAQASFQLAPKTF